MDRNSWDLWNSGWGNSSAGYYFDNNQYYGVVAPNVEIHTYDFVWKLDENLDIQNLYKGVFVDEKSLLWEITEEEFEKEPPSDHLRIHPEPARLTEKPSSRRNSIPKQPTDDKPLTTISTTMVSADSPIGPTLTPTSFPSSQAPSAVGSPAPGEVSSMVSTPPPSSSKDTPSTAPSPKQALNQHTLAILKQKMKDLKLKQEQQIQARAQKEAEKKLSGESLTSSPNAPYTSLDKKSASPSTGPTTPRKSLPVQQKESTPDTTTKEVKKRRSSLPNLSNKKEKFADDEWEVLQANNVPVAKTKTKGPKKSETTTRASKEKASSTKGTKTVEKVEESETEEVTDEIDEIEEEDDGGTEQEESEEEIEVEVQSTTKRSTRASSKGPRCLRNHSLKKFKTDEKKGWWCSACNKGFRGVTMFGCQTCDFDLCPKCAADPEARRRVRARKLAQQRERRGSSTLSRSRHHGSRPRVSRSTTEARESRDRPRSISEIREIRRRRRINLLRREREKERLLQRNERRKKAVAEIRAQREEKHAKLEEERYERRKERKLLAERKLQKERKERDRQEIAELEKAVAHEQARQAALKDQLRRRDKKRSIPQEGVDRSELELERRRREKKRLACRKELEREERRSTRSHETRATSLMAETDSRPTPRGRGHVQYKTEPSSASGSGSKESSQQEEESEEFEVPASKKQRFEKEDDYDIRPSLRRRSKTMRNEEEEEEEEDEESSNPEYDAPDANERSSNSSNAKRKRSGLFGQIRHIVRGGSCSGTKTLSRESRSRRMVLENVSGARGYRT